MNAGALDKIGRACLLVLPLVACTTGQTRDQGGCRYETAALLIFEDFVANPDRYAGKCVRVRGFATARGFDSINRPVPEMRGEVALYPSKAVQTKTVRGRGTVVGLATSCRIMEQQSQAAADKKNAELKAAGSDEIIVPMMTGPCHYRDTPVFRVDEWRPAPAEE